MSDPPRLFESDPVVRDAIEGARADVPDAKRLAKIAAGATAAAAVTTAATASATALKIVGAIVVVGAAVGVGVAVTHTSAPPNIPPSATATAPASTPAAVTVPVSALAPSASVSVTASTSAPAPVVVPPVDEMQLLDEAQRSLATDPQKSLSLCDKDAKANPRGEMAQEREVIAIDALMRLSRPAEAKERAAKFHATWPDSAHGRRVDALVELH